MQKRIWVVVVLIVLLALYQFASRPTGSATGELIVATEEPLQEPVQQSEATPFSRAASGYSWTITPQSKYRIAARVLSTERYRTGWQSSLSPLDLALGWGEFSKRQVDDWISWRQSARWYYYNWKGDSPYSGEQIKEHSANVHIVPATENVKRAVSRVSKNDVVLLEGLLINVDGSKGGETHWWHSSLSRTDIGDGSCELLYLKRLVLRGKEYQ